MVDKEQRNPLEFANVSLLHHNVATICDKSGHFSLAINDSITIDSLVVSYVGYSKTILPIVGDEFRHIELSQCPVSLNELHVPVPKKIKKHTIGKKHSSGLVLSVICDGDSLNPSPTKGETYGFEVHSRKNKSWLTKVGFYIKESYEMMDSMPFRINVYDMRNVKTCPTVDFENVLDKPITFLFTKDKVADGKYTYILPEPILLPQEAMIEIEFLENMNGRFFFYKGNMVGKSTWTKSYGVKMWDKCPFSTPFFIEYMETID